MRYVQQHGQLHYRQRWLRSGFRFGDGYLPDTHPNTGGESNADCNSYVYSDSHGGAHSDGDINPHSHSYGYSDSDSHGDTYSYGTGQSYTDAYTYPDPECDAKTAEDHNSACK